MKLSILENFEMFSAMKESNVVLYGAGERGHRALEFLERLRIKVIAVADKDVGKKLGEFEAISLDELCKLVTMGGGSLYRNTFCAITGCARKIGTYMQLRHKIFRYRT